MFQFTTFPFLKLCIYLRMTELFSAGFPHSDICGSIVICTSPQLFAAYHVLHRLLVPRHSPCALSCLTFFTSLTSNVVAILHFFLVCCSMCFFLFDSFFTCSVFKVQFPIPLQKSDFNTQHSLNAEIQPLNGWWAQVDSNHRPRAYQARALTC